MKAIVKEMKLDDKQYAPATIFSAISRAKNRLILPKQYADDIELRDRDRFAKVDQTYQIYAAYQDRLRQANAMDFDDLLIHTYLLFKNNGDICRRYADRFRYVLVDEYQDTNSVQQQIVLLLTSENQKICVVGDATRVSMPSEVHRLTISSISSVFTKTCISSSWSATTVQRPR